MECDRKIIKGKEILKCIDKVRRGKASLQMLRDLAVSEYGLINDSLRKMAWPLLLGVETPDPDWRAHITDYE
jgi:hypothetical protein